MLVVVMAKVQRTWTVFATFPLYQLLERVPMLFVADVAQRTGSECYSVGTMNVSNRSGSKSHRSVIARQQWRLMMAVQWHSKTWVEPDTGGRVWQIELTKHGLEAAIEIGRTRTVFVRLQQPVSFDFLRVMFGDGVLFQNSSISNVGRLVMESQLVSTDELKRRAIVGVFEVIVLEDAG